MPNLQKTIKLTKAQYDTLAGGGTVGNYTGLDPTFLYLVEEGLDATPTSGSSNPVTSGGVYTAINSLEGKVVTRDDEQTITGVKTFFPSGAGNPFTYTQNRIIVSNNDGTNAKQVQISPATVTVVGTSTSQYAALTPEGLKTRGANGDPVILSLPQASADDTLALASQLTGFATEASLSDYAKLSDIKVTNATVSTTGSGNAVTSVSISSGQIVANKGSTFLTSHQSLSNYVTLNTAQTITAKKTITTSAGNAGLDVQISGSSTGTNLTSIRGGSILIIPSSTSDQVYFGSTGITKYFTHSGSSPDTYTYTYPKKTGTIALTSDLPSTTDSVVKWTGMIANLRYDDTIVPAFYGTILWDKYAKKVRIVGGFYCRRNASVDTYKWPIDKLLDKVGLSASNIRTPADLDVGTGIVLDPSGNSNTCISSWMNYGGTMRYDVTNEANTGSAGLWYGRYYNSGQDWWGGFGVFSFANDNLGISFTAELEVY